MGTGVPCVQGYQREGHKSLLAAEDLDERHLVRRRARALLAERDVLPGALRGEVYIEMKYIHETTITQKDRKLMYQAGRKFVRSPCWLCVFSWTDSRKYERRRGRRRSDG